MKGNGCFGYLFLCLALVMFSFSSIGDATATTVTNFRLKNVNRKQIALSDYKKAKGFMIVFTCNKCPMAKFYSERLNKLSAQYQSKGVYLLAINAMDTLAYKEESFALMQQKAKKDKLAFPYLQDNLQVVAKQFKATHTPQAFVIWKNKRGTYDIKYQGAIDDNAGDASHAEPYLAEAVDDLLQNQPLRHRTSESFGCRIFYRGASNKMKSN